MKKVKLMVIGLDSLSLTTLDRFSKHIPVLRKLMDQGASGRALPSFPIYTPTNWAGLATGADPAVTGAAGWWNTASGERLSTFDRRAIKCDTIFDSAAREKLRTLAISYPSSHPTRSPLNMTLAPLDRGLVSNCLVPGKVVNLEFDAGGTCQFVLLEPPAAATGAALARAVGATQDGADLSGRTRKVNAQEIPAFLFKSKRGAFSLGFSPDPKKAKMKLREGSWSKPVPVNINVPGRPGKCVIRLMLFDNGKRLAVSEAYDIGMLGKPSSLAQKVYRRLGPPIEHSVFHNEMTKLFWAEAEDPLVKKMFRKELEAQADWIADAAAMVQETKPYDVFYLHYHYPDTVLHEYLSALESLNGVSNKTKRIAREALATSLEVCDRLVASLLRLADRNTTVLVVSDHGCVPDIYSVQVINRLIETGLTVLKKDRTANKRQSIAWRSPRVRTWICVNARPGTARYEEFQSRVIDSLLDWKTPDGRRVVALALRRKDSHILGYYGDECGDVTLHYNSGISWSGCPADKAVAESRGGAHHGCQMPATYSKFSDNMAFFALKGPGVKTNLRWNDETDGFIRLVDMVPTVCHISGVPAPRNVTGAVRSELLKH